MLSTNGSNAGVHILLQEQFDTEIRKVAEDILVSHRFAQKASCSAASSSSITFFIIRGFFQR